jgi:DNA adenine methylase
MSVLLRKPPSRLEVYNDKGERVVNYFKVLRERPDELVRAIQLTPFSRVELKRARHTEGDDDLERARKLAVLCWQSWGGPRARGETGWRFQRTDARGKPAVYDWNDTGHLWEIVKRLKNVQIECGEGIKVIERFDCETTLFYCDPPYVDNTRSERWRNDAYEHEMSDDDHRRLAEVLHGIEGMAIVSGYLCALYDELYGDWVCRTTTARNANNDEETEAIWISPRAHKTVLPLFALLGEEP